jgi:L-phenylalanine/L-methionine N-acetyltransferase
VIRSIKATDFDFIFNTYMHEATNPYLLYKKMSKEEFKPIFDDLVLQNIIFIFFENDKDIGMFKLIPFLHRTSHSNYLGGLAINQAFFGQGYGSKMLKEIIELGKIRNLKRIELSTATFNDKAIKLYEKHGFVAEGVLRSYTYYEAEDRYIDEQVMSFLY